MTNDLRDALASNLNEALLRASDGSVQLDRDTLRRAADELLWGEHMWGREFEALHRGDTVVIRRVPERAIPLLERRPAPTIEEAWAAAPESLRERESEHRASDVIDERKWLLVPQPLYSPDTPYDELPKRIIRQCCQSKTCGGTDLVKQRSEFVERGVPVTRYSYVRASNDEPHYAFGAATVAELIEQLNTAEWWPNRWADYVFEQYTGDDGLDFNAPEQGDVPADQ